MIGTLLASTLRVSVPLILCALAGKGDATQYWALHGTVEGRTVKGVGHTADLVAANWTAAMPDVKAIEDAVKALPPQDLAEFRHWFAEFDLATWDRQIESDVASGRLDALLAEADEDHRSGLPREV